MKAGVAAADATPLLEEQDSPREKAEQLQEDEENDPYETISSHLIELRQCIQTLTSLLNKIGTEKDSILVRRNVRKIKTSAHNLSKKIHLELAELRNISQKRRESQSLDINARRRRHQRKELENEYREYLFRLQSVFNALKEKETKCPPAKLHDDSTQTSEISVRNVTTNGATQQQLQLKQNMDIIELTDDDFQEDEKKRLEEVEQDLDELVEIFDHLADSVMEQEAKVDVICDNIQIAATDVHKGASDQQKAAKYSLMAAPLIGGAFGAIVGGPIGFAIGAHVAIGATLAIGAGVGVGAGFGAFAGFGTKKIAEKVNSVKKKLKEPNDIPIQEENDSKQN